MKDTYLGNYVNSRKNNLDLLRFIAATLVIFSHSYPLTLKSSSNEPFFVFTNQQSTFGQLAVAIFFIISGFLITQSFERSTDLKIFMKSRILRIFPGLFVVLTVSAFIMGPIFTSLSLSDYFSNILVYKYFVGFILIPSLSPSLPGVFETNPYGSYVNGSLWTLLFEFSFYIGVAFLGITKMLNKKIIPFLFILSLILSLLKLNMAFTTLFTLASYFSGGMLIYLFRDQIRLKKSYLIISIIIILITAKVGYFNIALAIFGTYIIMYIGFQQKYIFASFTKYGDFSYGLYIYAFPVQQSIIAIYHSKMTPLLNFTLAFPVALILAFISWHLVEKRALKLKYNK